MPEVRPAAAAASSTRQVLLKLAGLWGTKAWQNCMEFPRGLRAGWLSHKQLTIKGNSMLMYYTWVHDYPALRGLEVISDFACFPPLFHIKEKVGGAIGFHQLLTVGTDACSTGHTLC